MKDLALSLSGLSRKKLRTGLLIFAVFIAFLISAVLAAFSSTLTAGSTRFPSIRWRSDSVWSR